MLARQQPTASENLFEIFHHIETEPLCVETISKKHTRILLALHAVVEQYTDNSETVPHIPARTIHELICNFCEKSYPLGDVEAFTEDLVNRKYVMKLTDGVKSFFKISERGIYLLIQMQTDTRCVPHFEQSRSPNWHPSVLN